MFKLPFWVFHQSVYVLVTPFGVTGTVLFHLNVIVVPSILAVTLILDIAVAILLFISSLPLSFANCSLYAVANAPCPFTESYNLANALRLPIE